MNILVLGGGGRESAIAWKISQSSRKTELYVAPGNAGTSLFAKNVDLDILNFASVKDFIIEHDVQMLVVGPEQPLVEGIRDYFDIDTNFRDLMIVGPGKKGAQLEGSKDFSKAFMIKNGIQTAAYKTFTAESINEGKAFLKALNAPYVLKADGLASGKGVVILDNEKEAESALEDMLLNSKFGKASSKVVIEEFLSGIEMSAFILTDGKDYCLLPHAKDYKRIGDGDKGLNTGGMGSVSPVPFFTEELKGKIEEKIINPTLKGLAADSILYKGFLFFGLMICEGEPYLIEYNVRMGDPETQSVMPRIESDLVDLFEALCKDNLSGFNLKTSSQTVVNVVLAASNYPEKPRLGDKISIDKTILGKGMVFYAGAEKDKNMDIVSSGGRVLSVSAYGEDLQTAREEAYKSLSAVSMSGKYSRTDIGNDLL